MLYAVGKHVFVPSPFDGLFVPYPASVNVRVSTSRSILILALKLSSSPASLSGHSTPRKRVPGSNWVRCWSGPRARLDFSGKKSLPLPGIEYPRSTIYLYLYQVQSNRQTSEARIFRICSYIYIYIYISKFLINTAKRFRSKHARS
jgi:hypothetical protein